MNALLQTIDGGRFEGYRSSCAGTITWGYFSSIPLKMATYQGVENSRQLSAGQG